MNPFDITLYRLKHQQISFLNTKSPVEIIFHLGAIQAQDYAGAKWSIGLRMKDGTDITVEKALSDRLIVRTSLMRGTLFITTAADVQWIQQLVAPRILSGMKRRYSDLELTDTDFIRSQSIFQKALDEHKQLSRSQLLALLQQNGISTSGQRAPHLLQRAAYDGLLCQAHSIRNEAQYFTLDQIQASIHFTDRADAVAELASRYFTSHGPATLADFVWWSGLTVTEARAGLHNIKHLLLQESIAGQEYWFAAVEVASSVSAKGIFLLPGFDEFLLGYKDRSASLDPDFQLRWCPGNNGMFMPFIVSGGKVVGLWKRKVRKGAVAFDMEWFSDSVEVQSTALALAKKQFEVFLGIEK